MRKLLHLSDLPMLVDFARERLDYHLPTGSPGAAASALYSSLLGRR
jgi:hypothetical protein